MPYSSPNNVVIKIGIETPPMQSSEKLVLKVSFSSGFFGCIIYEYFIKLLHNSCMVIIETHLDKPIYKKKTHFVE